MKYSTLFFHFKKVISSDLKNFNAGLITLIILVLLAGFLLVVTWIGLLGLLFLFFVSLKLSYFLALLSVVGINFLLLIIALMIILKLKKKLLFPETNELLDELLNR